MSKKILLADDSLTIQKVVELTFSDSDFDLVCVSNGLRALEKVHDDRPDLVLADVVMPEKNGYEVCEAIKADPGTSRIPVILLTGTFEPFDKHRAERIGADAIVSKPFDSQQLLRQVEALLSRASSAPSAATVAMRIPEDIARGTAPPPLEVEEGEPFDAGFSPEDFTGSIRLPAPGDPFEEEYGRGDVDSAVEAFEKAQQAHSETPREEDLPVATSFEEQPEAASWLEEEGERSGSPERSHWVKPQMPSAPRLFEPRADEAPTAEIPTGSWALPPRAPEPEARPAASESGYEEISADAAHALFDVPAPKSPREESEPVFERSAAFGSTGSGPASSSAFANGPTGPSSAASMSSSASGEPAPAGASTHAASAETGEVAPPRELEELAQTKSIPELAQMLSSVSKGGDPLTEAEIDRLAERVVEKLSDRVIREIAWEVIPDMAEIVIKQRIKELEAGLE